LDVFNIPELHAAFKVIHLAKFGEEASLPSASSTTASAPSFTIELGLRGNDDDDGPKKTEK